MSKKRNVYRLLVGKPEGKRPLGRPRCRWIDNIKMDILEIKLGGVDWIGLAHVFRVENATQATSLLSCLAYCLTLKM
jgi:hypothetical protein